MDPKTTQELLNELKCAQDVGVFLQSNQAALIDMDLKGYLERLLSQKGCTKAQAIKRSGLHEIYAYQIFAGKKSPSRDKVIALCLGMRLDVEEAQHLLQIAGAAALYPRISRDSIILFALKKGLSAMECDEMLYELQERTLNG